MPRKAYSGSFRHAEEIIRDYKENKRMLRELEEAVAYPARPESEEGKSYRISDPTAKRCIDLISDMELRFYREAVNAVEKTLEEFLQYSDGNAKLLIIKLVYWDKTHTLYGAASEAFYSHRQARRHRENFVRSVMRYMGW